MWLERLFGERLGAIARRLLFGVSRSERRQLRRFLLDYFDKHGNVIDGWSEEDAVLNILLIGLVGSGKSSAGVHQIKLNALLSGWSVFSTTAKTTDIEDDRKIAKIAKVKHFITGPEADLCIDAMNAITKYSADPEAAAARAYMSLGRLVTRSSGSSGENQFFETAAEQHLLFGVH